MADEPFAGRSRPREISQSIDTRDRSFGAAPRICSAVCARVNCTNACCATIARHARARAAHGHAELCVRELCARRCMLMHNGARSAGRSERRKRKGHVFWQRAVTFVIRRRFLLFGPRAAETYRTKNIALCPLDRGPSLPQSSRSRMTRAENGVWSASPVSLNPEDYSNIELESSAAILCETAERRTK